MGTAALEGLAGGTGRKQAGETEKRKGNSALRTKAGDSLMKADTGRILRQRFCFLMAMVSCRNGGKEWGQAARARNLTWSSHSSENLFRVPPASPSSGAWGIGIREEAELAGAGG